MHNTDVPIVLTRPPDFISGQFDTYDEANVVLKDAAKKIFTVLEIPSFRFIEPPMPNQSYLSLLAGCKDGFEYEIHFGEGPHYSEYPFWIWVGLEHFEGWDDKLPQEAHSVAARLSRSGYRCLVRGYISAMGKMAL